MYRLDTYTKVYAPADTRSSLRSLQVIQCSLLLPLRAVAGFKSFMLPSGAAVGFARSYGAILGLFGQFCCDAGPDSPKASLKWGVSALIG